MIYYISINLVLSVVILLPFNSWIFTTTYVKTLGDKQYACMVFCDISKAFDRAWHKGLLFKLKQNGIKGDIFYGYLTIQKNENNMLSSILQIRKLKA